MKRIQVALLLWLLIGIALPALLSYGILNRVSQDQGVLVSIPGQSFRQSSFEEAIAYLIKNRVEGDVELRAYLWVPRHKNLFFFIKGPPRQFLFDGYEMRHLSKCAQCMGDDSVPPGLHYIIIRLENVSFKFNPEAPLESNLEFFWVRDSVVPQPIPAHLVYLEYPRTVILQGAMIARVLGILARLNCVLLFLIPALVALYKRFDRSIKSSGVFLLIFFALMLMIRYNGIGYQLEEGIHPDERAVENIVSSFRTGNLKPMRYHYSPGFHYMTAGFENLMAWIMRQDPPLHLGPRLLSILFSWLACLLVLSIGNILFSRTSAIIACILFGFSFMPVSLAHFGIIEPAMVFFFLLAFLFILRINKEAGRNEFLKAGLASGLAVGIKQTAAIIFVPFLSMYLFTYGREAFRKTVLKKTLWWVGGAVIAYLFCAPYTVLDFSNFLKDQIFQFKFLSGHTSTMLFFWGESSGVRTILEYLEDGVGYPLLVTAAIGCIFLWRESLKAFVAIVPITLIFFLIACMAKAAPYHYPLLLCPFLALLAAVVIQNIAGRIRFSSVALGVFTFLLLFPSLTRVAKLEEILLGTDTREKAAVWCYRNIPSGSAVDSDFFGPRLLIPLFYRRVIPLFARGSWHHYEKLLPNYFIMDSVSTESSPREEEWYEQLRQNGDVIQEFSGVTQGIYNPHILIYKIRPHVSNHG